jgi:leucyl-tRNA synthetase/predicted alpha/beta hydrolase family esterase
MSYNHQKIEQKWQKYWEKDGLSRAVDGDNRPKFYGLIEFPYPSGEGLHVGHIRSNTAMDIICRKRRMQGFNALYPIGWDAFGLPTENYAIKTDVHPAVVTKKNTDTFRRQLKELGFSFDWSREINTTDPEYYKWTQWIFLQFFKKGLAYKKKMAVNWCPSCKIGLANEEVVDGYCERCGTPAEKREKEQWLLAITKYADRLDKDLDSIDFLEKIKIQQRNWIGRKEGINITYPIEGTDDTVTIFTTRPDTNYGATFVVLAPENELVEKITLPENKKAIQKYAAQVQNKSESERIAEGRKKTGVFTGRFAINHLTGKKMPIWVSDFVLAGYGTGAVVGVPGHDLRDFEFAQEFGLEIIRVVVGKNGDKTAITKAGQVQEEEGKMVNSGILNGLEIHEATKKIMDYIEERGWGKKTVTYHLRDWIFSRQHYWGEPIPMIYCEGCAKRKYNFILLHGYGGRGNSNYRPWLKRELENGGHKVFTPDLPDTEKPNVNEQAGYVIKNFKLDEKTILLGGSLGGSVVMRVLEKIKGRIAKAVLVDPVVFPEFNDRHRPAVKAAHDWKFNFKKIKKAAAEIILIGDKNFPIITRKQLIGVAEKLDTPLILAETKEPHFKAEQEPEILKLFENPGWIPVPEKDLPVELPKVEKYQPTNTGESPLAGIAKWVNVKCSKCGGPARRETDTMPNWAGSSWYYLRYTDPNNKKEFADFKKLKYWTPVDWYNGGMEHTTLHLLYSRFWHKFLFDLGLVPTSEPYAKRTSHGLIIAEGGVKMSKSKGNVINPDEIVKKFGADALRIYEMFMGPFDQAIAWSADGLAGARRFLEKIWQLKERIGRKAEGGRRQGTEKLLHKTIKKVTDDIEALKFNTAISAMMILANEMEKEKEIFVINYSLFVILLSPFAPHLAEELWAELGNKQSIFKEKWPQYDPELAKDQTINLVLQVNGKVRDTVEAAADIGEDEAKKLALESEKIKKWLAGRKVAKVIFVKGRLVNIVIQ